MNTLGRMFIILIFIMSIMFMSFSVVIFATHTNWKDRAANLEKQLKDEQQKASQIIDKRDEAILALREEIKDRQRVTSNLNAKVEELASENTRLNTEVTDLAAMRDKNIDALMLSHQSLVNVRAELEGLRKDFRKSQQEWTELYSQLVAKTDEAHALAMRLATYRSVGEQLAKDYRDAMDVLKKNGLKPDPSIYSMVPPKNVQGIVTEVRPNGWVQISIGSDSGLVKGQRLDIVRKSGNREIYIGKLEIDTTTVDSAVARILTDYRRGTVQRDDTVLHIDTTELSSK